GDPSRSLTVTGVTGTNGKSTTAWLLAQALGACGRSAAYLGTLGAAYAGDVEPGEHTTPDAVTLQRQLAQFQARGAGCVALEVSSHALQQGRVAAVTFDAAVFTNLTRDHLDYHGSMERYGSAKSRLFEAPGLRLRVINADDDFGAELLRRPEFAGSIAISSAPQYAAPAGQRCIHAVDIELGARGVAFTANGSFGSARVHAPLVGRFNVDNLLAVLAVLVGSGIPLADATAAVGKAEPPPGRMEIFGGDGLPLIAVDYAHTPDALEKALRALRAHCKGRLICVFGCGGDRDRGKRPQMGRIAATFADVVILTDDNPRSESPSAITDEIRSGMDASAAVVVHDRAMAIAAALSQAGAADVVLIAGKGHETHQQIGTESRSFSDQHAVRWALRHRVAS
ncbi:MAG: UDP-N-acetylmuramoyl-L-alanyl-D-glutamate--2,6-diaminopimelate ligase, partial [Pseudomonadota bacterium]